MPTCFKKLSSLNLFDSDIFHLTRSILDGFLKIVHQRQIKFLYSLLFILLFKVSVSAQVCGTSGLDGPQNAVPPVNTYYPLATNASLTAGSKSITLLAVPPNDPYYNLSYGSTQINAGDLILIIQMQDADINYSNSTSYGSGTSTSGPDGLGGTGYTSLGNSGKFEYVVATSSVPLTGGTLTFRGAGTGGGCVNSYTNSNATSTQGQKRFQVVRVPQYSNLVLNSNITTPPYNGSVGGLIAFDVAGTMQFNGFYVDASERGFRGGYGPVAASNANNSTDYVLASSSTKSVGKGEGIAGTPRYMWDGFVQVDNGSDGLPGGSYGRGAPANAGGGGNDHNSGGGGGANGGYGGLGGMGWQGAGGDVDPLSAAGRPGTALPVDYSRLVMGGGGGGGDANNATSGVKGGVGGGIILINVDKIDGAGTIRSNGGDGQPGNYGSKPDGAGGGGAGGSIFVRSLAASPTANLTIEAKGGKGGNTKFDTGGTLPHGPGGGGGGGFIYTQVPSATISTNVAGGASGKTNNGHGITHGAMDGSSGQASTFSTSDLPNYLQGGGSICYPELTTTLSELNAGPSGARNAGATATYTLTISNDPTNGNAGNVEAWLDLPSMFKFASVNVAYTGDATGTLDVSPSVGNTGKLSFGHFNISPGDKVILTIVVNIDVSAPVGVYQASAQATYLDPTRTIADPYRKITGQNNAFSGFNTTYETGGVSNVIGINYDGNLLSSTAEDVYLNAATSSTTCNAITDGGFDHVSVGNYPSGVNQWTPINSGESVQIVTQGGSTGAAIKQNQYSLKQTIQSVKPSFNYIFSMDFKRWTDNTLGCNTNSNANINIKIYDAANPSLVFVNQTTTSNNNNPFTLTYSFLTSASTTSLVVEIQDTGSPPPSCPLFADNATINSALNFSYHTTNVTCNGAHDGKLTVTDLEGAAAPYTISYSYNGGAYSTPVSVNPVVSPSTYDITGLVPGSYVVSVADKNGCGISANFTITEPSAISLSATHVDNSCGNTSIGSIDLSVSGGTAPYTYSWTRNGSAYAGNQQDLTNLPPGTYQVTVTDNNGCSKQLSVDILPLTPFVLTGSNTNLTCNSDPIGTITLNPSGGVAPYSFTWSDGSHDQNRTNLLAGTYSVIGKDALGCEISLSYTITEPPAITISSSYNPILCYGNVTDVTITASGGTGTLNYSKDGISYQTSNVFTSLTAGDYVFYVIDTSGCLKTDSVTISQPASALAMTESHTSILCQGGTSDVTLTATGGTSAYQYSKDGITYQNSNIFSGLSAGSYTFYVKDANSCTQTLSTNITEPTALNITEIHEDVKCYGDATGSIDITVSGGTTPYSYSWSNGQTIEDISSLSAGNYTVTVTDGNGCTAQKIINVTEPAQLQLNAIKGDVSCYGEATGSINLTVTGGTAPYTYLWSNGATTEDISNLSTGNYSVTVSDAHGCFASKLFNISQPASALSLSETHINNTCFAENAGSIDLTVTGGTTPYIYSWSNGATTQDISGLAPGNYTVTVTDGKGCSQTLTVTITPLAPFVVNPTKTDVSCYGDATGAIQLNPSGGVSPYTISWSSGQSTADITGLTIGTYHYTATDVNGCVLTGDLTLTQPVAPLSITNTKQDVKCYGDASGSIDITVAGGTAPYTYSWSNGSTAEDIGSLISGNYTVTVTDNNGCTLQKTVTITQPLAALSITDTEQDVKCYGDATGSIDITATGGTAPYSYSWSNSTTTEDQNNLIAGNYTVTVTDNNGCMIQKTITINQPAAPLSITNTKQDVGCHGDHTGSIDITVTGGTTPYSYSWSNGQTTEDISDLYAGNYTITVTDGNGCTAQKIINITEPAELQLNASKVDVSCYGEATGSINLTVSGGTAPYTYLWSNGATTEDISNLPAGIYSVTVTDAHGCFAPIALNISQPTSALSLSETHINNTCFAENAGSIDLSVAGGTTPYTYSWSNGATTQDISGLAPGNYTVTVTDVKGCSQTLTVTITPLAPFTISSTKTDILCHGSATGHIELNLSGGTLPYTVNWNTGATTQDISNLTAGTYSYTAVDGNGCTISNSITLTEPAALNLVESHSAILCQGGTSDVNLTATGGTGAYQYSKDGSNYQSSSAFTGLIAGTYTFYLKDAHDCLATLSLTITEPAALSLSESHTSILCNGGTSDITLTATGGTGTYQYSKDAVNYQSSASFTGLTAGNYSFYAKDTNNCVVSINITITQPTLLSLTGVNTPINCHGGTSDVTLTATGGTSVYQYSKDGISYQSSNIFSGLTAGNYNFFTKDNNGCVSTFSLTITEPAALTLGSSTETDATCFGTATGSVSAGLVEHAIGPVNYVWKNSSNVVVGNNPRVNNLPAGTYTLTVNDDCSSLSNAVIIKEPTALSLNGTSTAILCNGGVATTTLSAGGGTTPYQYSKDGINYQNSTVFAGLLAGSYTFYVKDANGCIQSFNTTINEPTPLSLTENHTDVKCYGEHTGSINVTVSGGTAPYTYQWNNGETTEDINGLAAGNYNLTLTDANGCAITKSITILQPSAPLSIAETHQDVNCYNDATGSINITIAGGTLPYSYAWSDGQTTEDISELTSGNYTVTVTDGNGCMAQKTITITQPVAPLSVSETHQNNICYGQQMGKIDLTVSGGTAPYAYSWSNRQTTQDISNLPGGTYTCIIKDANQCEVQISVTITPLTPFSAKETLSQVKCYQANNGSIFVELSGGIPPYAILWSNGSTSTSIDNLAAGNYSYIAKDAYGCSIQKSITITEPQPLKATIRSSPTSCKFTKDGSLYAQITGGTPPYQVFWNDVHSASSGFMDGLGAGTYTLKVIDSNNCQLLSSGTVAPGNCAPKAADDGYETLEDTPIRIQTPGVMDNDRDPDLDTIHVILDSAKDPNVGSGSIAGNKKSFRTLHGKVDIQDDGSFIYTPDLNFNGIEKFIYEVSDGSLNSNYAVVTIKIQAVNDPPVAINDDYTTLEDTPVSGSVGDNDSDVENDPLYFTQLTQPQRGQIVFNSDGTFTYTPAPNDNGTVTFDYQVCDPSGACDTATVTIHITPVDDPPVAVDDQFYVETNKQISNTVTTNDYDIENDPLIWTPLTQPAHGTLVFNPDGTFTYQPNNGFKGIDTYTYRTCDPSGLCDEATVTLIVQPIVTVNLTPSVGQVSEGDTISITAKLTESILEDATITLSFGGTATLQADYTLSGNYQTITIPAGQDSTTQKFVMHTINDALRDPGEQVIVTITQVDSKFVLIGTGSVVTIDDVYPESIPFGPDENPDINPDPLVSPNGDGQGNESFIIYNISKYPNNEVVVFNRWGNEVFRIKGYNNEDKSFKGVANVGILTNSNKDLVNGVYYYLIYTEVDNKKKLNKGYLILKR